MTSTPSQDSPAWGGEAATDPNLGPIIWVVGSSFDRRADMLWENKPCDSDEMVLAVVKDALARNATEIKVRCYPAYTWRMGGEEAFEALADLAAENAK